MSTERLVRVDVWYTGTGDILAWAQPQDELPVDVIATPLAADDTSVVATEVEAHALERLHETHRVEEGEPPSLVPRESPAAE